MPLYFLKKCHCSVRNFFALPSLLAIALVAGCGGSGSDESPPPPSVSSFQLSADQIWRGDSVQVSWSATLADSCKVNSRGDLPSEGALTLTPSVTGATSVVLVCSNKYGTTRREVTLLVTDPPQSLEVLLDSSVWARVIHFDNPIDVRSPTTEVASTVVTLVFKSIDDDPSQQCRANDRQMTRLDDGSFSVSFEPAYFFETIELSCSIAERVTLNTKVNLYASDPQLDAAISLFLQTAFPESDTPSLTDSYSAYRRASYYDETYRFLAAAAVYRNPDLFNVPENGTIFKRLESYLLNTSEAFFEPCVDYDFYNGPMRQCRSENRVGKYYLWRSPFNNEASIRTSHAKVEWRAAGGAAQAIKALLERNPPNKDEACVTSDRPSTVRNQSLSCRALNVRRLLYAEVWRKWSDVDWVASIGFGPASTIQGTDVSHYIAWNELTYDLFNSTKNIQGVFDCNAGACIDWNSIASRRDALLGFFYYRDGYLHISCRPPDFLTGCEFLGNDFQVTGSNDLSHLDMVIQVVSSQDTESYCTADGSKCIVMTELAKTMNDRTWVESLGSGVNEVGFPKFDLFFNGYCQRAYKTPDSALQQFCLDYWVTERLNWPAHRKLFGWVNLGKADRQLMLKLRKAADENHDNVLSRDDVFFFNTYSVFLYSALAKNGGPIR